MLLNVVNILEMPFNRRNSILVNFMNKYSLFYKYLTISKYTELHTLMYLYYLNKGPNSLQK